MPQMNDITKRFIFIPHPENHVRKSMDEWFSGGILPIFNRDRLLHRNPERKETMAVKPWSFIFKNGVISILDQVI